MKYIRAILFATAVACAMTPLFAQNSKASAGRPDGKYNYPANVPSEYLATPFGYLHPSCVQKLAKGEKVLADGRRQYANGDAESSPASCSYQRYNSTGLPAGSGRSVLPAVTGWVENANITTGSSSKAYGAMVARWKVPQHPAANDGQYLFFFPGFEDINEAESILQPVLQWSAGQWALASWNCCMSGVAWESPLVNVKPGDSIYGSITSTCPAGSLNCQSWNVLSLDLTTGDSTALSYTPSEGQVFNWAFGGVLETYYVGSCQDLPASHSISFTKITVFDQNLVPVPDPQWTEATNSYIQPTCSFNVKTRPDGVALSWQER